MTRGARLRGALAFRAFTTQAFVMAVAVGLLASIPWSEVGAQALPAPDTSTRMVGTLRAGDLLGVVVFRDEELSGEYLIDAQGDVQIPGLGVVRVAGLTPEQVKRRLAEQMMERGIVDPDIAVLPVVRLSVLGEVRVPGQQRVEPGTSLLQLLTMAGGLTERADPSKARVLREGRSFPVDLEGALAGSAAGNVVLFSNDVLVVPRAGGWTRENLTFFLSLTGVVLSLANVMLSAR